MRLAAFLLLMTFGIGLSAQNSNAMIGNAKKLIVVTSDGWNDVNGTMTRYERRGKTWKQVAKPIAIVVGKNGMAWDGTYLKSLPGPLARIPVIKQEGDGKSPAGIFRISHSFGFAPKITNNDFYIPVTPTTECVDDINSKYYNQIVDRLNIKDVDWNSSEKMRHIEGYRYGAVVAFNDSPVAGRGSCIFLHIWSGPGQGTAGCTAMPDSDAQKLLEWVDDKTVLVQMPKAEYERLKSSLQLP
jgi:zinc D-Ala-D-Ala dipeptidase